MTTYKFIEEVNLITPKSDSQRLIESKESKPIEQKTQFTVEGIDAQILDLIQRRDQSKADYDAQIADKIRLRDEAKAALNIP